jgi:drug/metabolite transporter (DMT)-like permease
LTGNQREPDVTPISTQPTTVGAMRRPTTLELMLLATIGLWSLNLTVSRYILTHGLQPLAYGSVRYALASGIFCAMTLAVERSLRIARRDLPLVLAAALVLYVNQLGFVYALHESTASVLALLLGATPIFAAIAGVLLRTETLSGRFWSGALLSFAGVALVAIGAGDQVSGSFVGVLLGLLTATSWAAYSMLITPLMRRYSASRISSIVLTATSVPLTLTALPQLESQDWSLGWEVWALLLFATLGPLVATNVMWFRSLDRIGPARATLAANLQPFVAAAIAVVVLSESLGWLEVAGGLLIAVGIVAARRRGTATPPGE